MKRFIYRSIAFIAFVVATLIILGICIPYPDNGYEKEQFIKMSMLAKADRKPSIVLLGGSNVAFGYNSKMLEDSIGIPVINAGLHAGIGLKMIVDDCARYLQKGDILILSPEISHFFNRGAYGEYPLAYMYFMDPANYAPLLNQQQWRVVVGHSCDFIRHNVLTFIMDLVHKQQTDVYHVSSFNQYGDVVWHWYNSPQNKYHGVRDIQKKLSPVNWEYFGYLIEQLKSLESKGIQIIMYPSVMSATYYENNYLDINWIERAFEECGYPFICPHSRTTNPDSLMYDTHYHCLKEGAELHTQNLISLLKQAALDAN